MHRLGGAGLAAFDRQTQSLQSFAALSQSLSQAQITSLHSQLAQFRTALSRFATDHRDEIKRDPAFRLAFQQMCASIGVDPLAGPRKGGWWAELLGLGDWQYELGVQIVDICVNTRERNGGVIEMGELIRMLSKLRGVSEGGEGAITEDDVIRSIKTLAPLGAGYEIIELAGGQKLVRSVPRELDNDQATALALAQMLGGFVDISALVESQGWTRERSRAVLENMHVRDGLCWVDEQDEGGTTYWVPSVTEWGD
ncbi:hypothetical protein FRB99_004967 [Tulasnella sp. 403]|nr:hypothetical protein FRB99_004967 [Tulasnella sp. 403]